MYSTTESSASACSDRSSSDSISPHAARRGVRHPCDLNIDRIVPDAHDAPFLVTSLTSSNSCLRGILRVQLFIQRLQLNSLRAQSALTALSRSTPHAHRPHSPRSRRVRHRIDRGSSSWASCPRSPPTSQSARPLRAAHLRLRTQRRGRRTGPDRCRPRLPRKPVLAGLMVLFVVGKHALGARPGLPPCCWDVSSRRSATEPSSVSAPSWRRHGCAPQEGGRDCRHVHRPHGSERAGVPLEHCWGRPRAGVRRSGRSARSASSPLSASSHGPVTERGTAGTTGLRGELRAFRSGQVWASIAITVLGYGGMFGAFTYIAFTSRRSAASAARRCRGCSWCSVWVCSSETTLGGKAADRNVDATLLGGAVRVDRRPRVFALTAARP